MTAIILVIHVLIALAMIVVVLIQRSDGGALGGLGGGAFGGVMSGRASANLLTRTTTVLAAAFMATSMVLAILASGSSGPRSITDELPAAAPESESIPRLPVPDPAGAGGEPDGPQVPVRE